MCGIVGCIGVSDPVDLVFQGLARLEYRGYDSAGIVVRVDAPEPALEVIRAPGRLAALEAKLDGLRRLSSTTAAGHTRWATHGAATEANAHPHRDCRELFAVVHNGVLENYGDLAAQLRAEGHCFRSETDTEVIAHLLEDAARAVTCPADPTRQPDYLAAVVGRILPRLRGSQVVLAVSRELSSLVAFRLGNGGALGVAASGDGYIVASDSAALGARAQEVTYLDPGEIAIVAAEGVAFFDAAGQRQDGPRRSYPVAPPVTRGEDGISTFMMREILDQPEALRQGLDGRVRRSPHRRPLEGLDWSFDRIVMTACGTPWNACLVGRQYFEQLARIPTQVEFAHEYVTAPELPLDGALFIAATQSGETADVLLAIEKATAAGATTMALTNVAGSAASRLCDLTWDLSCGPEYSVAQTKAFTSQLLAMLLVAEQAGRARGTIGKTEARVLLDALAALPEQAARVITDADAACREIAARYVSHESYLFLGRGLNHPIAYEGALKLKELSYAHAEGYAAAEMKHGPIALIRPGYPVVGVVPRDRVHAKMLNQLEQVKARGARVLAVGSPDDPAVAAIADDLLPVPDVPDLIGPILNVIPLQLFAFHVASLRGCDVDHPRNLAKSVTVE